MDRGDDGEFPKPWLNASVLLDAADVFAKAVAATPASSKYREPAVSILESVHID